MPKIKMITKNLILLIFERFRLANKQGFSLLSTIIALGITSVSAFALLSHITTSSKNINRLETKSEILAIKNLLTKAIDCEKIFSDANIVNPNDSGVCNGTSIMKPSQFGKRLPLFRRTYVGNSRAYGTRDALGYVHLDSWLLAVTCSAKENSLIVKAAKVEQITPFTNKTDTTKKSISWAKDPVLGIDYDFDHPSSLLFSGSTTPLCYHYPLLTSELANTTLSIGVNGLTLYEKVDVFPPNIRTKSSNSIVNFKRNGVTLNGIKCKNGWRMVSCNYAEDTAPGFDGQSIQNVVKKSAPYFWDRDIYFEDNMCLTDDIMEASAENYKTTISLSAICAREL